MKQIVTNYTLSTTAKTITLTDFSSSHPVDLKRLYLITDTTTNKVLYNFSDSTVAGATISSNNIITLSTLQGGESNTDSLLVLYEVNSTDPTYQVPLLPSNAAQETGGNLATIAGTVSGGKVNATVVGTGTFAVQAGSSTAIGSVVPANAFYEGLLAQTANPTATSAGNLVGALSDKLGKQVVVGSIRTLKGFQQTTITSSTSETTIVTANATSFLDLYGLVIANTSTNACQVTIKSSTGGTVTHIFAVPPNDTRGFMVPESAAFNQAAINNNWTATCGTSVASISITAAYVTNL